MEVERYKIIYTTKINKIIENALKNLINVIKRKQKIKGEIYSDNIRILGHEFVKNNKNKVKLIINNKKYRLKELINSKEIYKR